MHRSTKKLALVAAIALIASCSKSDNISTGTGDGDVLGGSGGTTVTGQVAFFAGNYESVIKFISPRVQNIVSEAYRVLEILHEGEDENTDADDPADAILAKMVDASRPAPDFDPFTDHNCEMTEGIQSEFKDNDGNSLISAGDEILRQYGNAGCPFNIDDSAVPPTPRNQPAQLTGSLLYRFSGATNNATTGVYEGTLTFNNYEQADGLLKMTDEAVTETFNGTLNFSINFATGNATFDTISVVIDGTDGSFNGPNLIEIDSVIRTINSAGNDSVQILGGSMTSQISGVQTTFETVNYNGNTGQDLIGPTGGPPTQGALIFYGDNSATRVVTRPGGGGTPAQLDSDGDGDFSEGVTLEPTSIGWLVDNFFMPGF